MIVEQLHAIQEHYGYLPKEQLKKLSAQIAVPLHRLHEVISFFPHFRMEPPPDVEVHVCRDQACHLRGGAALPVGAQGSRRRFWWRVPGQSRRRLVPGPL